MANRLIEMSNDEEDDLHLYLSSSSDEEDDEDTHFDDSLSKTDQVVITKKYDLKYLSPLIILDKDCRKLLTSSTRIQINRTFEVTVIAENSENDIFSDYYQYNRNKPTKM